MHAVRRSAAGTTGRLHHTVKLRFEGLQGYNTFGLLAPGRTGDTGLSAARILQDRDEAPENVQERNRQAARKKGTPKKRAAPQCETALMNRDTRRIFYEPRTSKCSLCDSLPIRPPFAWIVSACRPERRAHARGPRPPSSDEDLQRKPPSATTTGKGGSRHSEHVPGTTGRPAQPKPTGHSKPRRRSIPAGPRPRCPLPVASSVTTACPQWIAAVKRNRGLRPRDRGSDRIIEDRRYCRGPDSNRHSPYGEGDFKSPVSTTFTTPA